MANDGKTYLTFHRAFAANSTATFTDKEGVLRPLIRVSIPSGTVLGGRDIGGDEHAHGCLAAAELLDDGLLLFVAHGAGDA